MGKKPVTGVGELTRVLQRGLEGAQLSAYQHSRLLEVCAHAETTVPLYRDGRLEPITSTGRFTSASWRTVPVLRRSEVAANLASLQSQQIPTVAGPTRATYTSGTSGQPLKFEVSHLADIYSQIGYRRYFQAWKIDRNFKLLTVRPPKKQAEREVSGIQVKNLPGGYGVEYTSFNLEVQNTIAAIQRVRPDYIRTFPSIAAEIARRLHNEGTDLGLKLVMTVGETVSPEIASDIRECLGCNVADAYAAEEVQLIAYACPKCQNYHCTNDNLFVELLDDQDNPVGVGQIGRVVVTTLNNFAMPLIRYELEDYAVRGSAIGSCGRKGTLIRRIMGRRRNMFRMRDGRSIWPIVPAGELYRLGVGLFQFIQQDFEKLKFLYTSESDLIINPLLINELVHTYIDPSFEVTVERRADLRAASSGKLIHYQSVFAQE